MPPNVEIFFLDNNIVTVVRLQRIISLEPKQRDYNQEELLIECERLRD